MISFIIPTWNEEKYVGDLLHSLKKSLVTTPYEIIVTDAGSTDKTLEVARQFADKVVEFPKDVQQNISKNRNFGASFARGDFLMFMDADARLDNPQVDIDKLLTRFAHDPELVALTVKLAVYPQLARFIDNVIFGIVNFNFTIMNNYLRLGGAFGKLQLVKKSAFSAVGGYNESLVAAEDMNLFSKLHKIGRVRIDRSITVYHSNRRARRIGWFKLLWIWNMNGLSALLRNKSVSKEWTPIR